MFWLRLGRAVPLAVLGVFVGMAAGCSQLNHGPGLRQNDPFLSVADFVPTDLQKSSNAEQPFDAASEK